MEQINVHWLRNNITLINTKVALFPTSVLNNIQIGTNYASFHEVVEVAKEANAHDFIMQLPNGYDTLIGQNGYNLLPWQTVLIGIARALIRKPKVILIDQVDSLYEQVDSFMKNLLFTEEQLTLLIIPNKVSFFEKVDNIFVLINGQITENGIHEELLSKEDSFYKKLYEEELLLNNVDLTVTKHENVRERSKTVNFDLKYDSNDGAPLKNQMKYSDTKTNYIYKVFQLFITEWKFLIPSIFAAIATTTISPSFALFFSQFFEVSNVYYKI